MNLARTAYRQNEQVTLDRLEAFGEASVYFPLKAPMRVRGVLAVHAGPDGASRPERQTLLMTAASLTAIALERLHYVDVAQSTQLQMQSERLRSSILSALSHDIRTPLTALVGLADSLTLTAPPLPVAAHETAAAIADQAGQLHRLVENLLDMARLNAGEIRLRREWCLIEDVIGSSLKLLQHTLDPYNIRVELPSGLPLVEFDAVLIERVLGNLLENAAKYSPSGSGITLTVQNTGEELWVAVGDTGPGLPLAVKPDDLFNLFVRGDEESAIPGAGLGLAICKTIVEAHGGVIQAANRPGGGACFRFSLPLGAAPELDDEAVVLARREAT
jgi:two-component system sensor histidine kinase KdpD